MQACVHRVMDKDRLAQDSSSRVDTDYLNTQANETQVETIGSWVRRTGGREFDLKREEG